MDRTFLTTCQNQLPDYVDGFSDLPQTGSDPWSEYYVIYSRTRITGVFIWQLSKPPLERPFEVVLFPHVAVTRPGEAIKGSTKSSLVMGGDFRESTKTWYAAYDLGS